MRRRESPEKPSLKEMLQFYNKKSRLQKDNPTIYEIDELETE